MSGLRVLIVGAGIGGLGAAAALAATGHDVDVVEIKSEPNVYGVGINQPANSLRALDRLGVLADVLDAGFVWDRLRFCDADGNLVADVPSGLGDHDVPANNGLSRRDLHAILIGAADRAGAQVRYGTTVADVEESRSARVTFTDGTTGEYDLVVAFDGISSPMRKRLFGDGFDPVYTGYAVWRVTVPRPAEMTQVGIYQAAGAKAGHIPLSQDTMYLLLVVPDAEGVHHDPAAFPDLLRERLGPFAGPVARIRDELIPEGAQIVYSPLSEVLLPAPWFRDRVLVCGDAAHACTPHITQGAAMALEDAVVLAEELVPDRGLAASLTAFNERRFPRVKFVQDVSRGILEAEMAINENTIDDALTHMRENLPDQQAAVDRFLNQPA